MKDTIKNLQNEILKRQEAIAVFETEIEASGSVNQGIRENIREVKAANMREVLGCIPEGVTIRESDGRFEFLREGDRYGAMFSVYSQKRGWYDEPVDPSKELNYYTTNCDNDSEFQRLALLGKVAEKLSSLHNQYLFNRLNDGAEDMIKMGKELDTKLMRLQDMKRRQESEIRDLEDQILLAQAEEGIEVDMKDAAWFEINTQRSWSSVCGVKIMGKSASGKTLDVQLSVVMYDYKDGLESNSAFRKQVNVTAKNFLPSLKGFLKQSNTAKEYRLIRELAKQESAS